MKHDPAIIAGALSALELAVARALTLAPVAAKELEDMAGTHVVIECTRPEVEVTISIDQGGQLQLRQYSEEVAVTRVKGSAEDFISLVTADDPAATLINSELEIIGNTAPLLALQQILSKMDIDWEAPLVDVLGDVAGHQLAKLLRAFFSWSQSARKSLRRQLSEFILEEGQLSPPGAELEHFYQEVGRLGLRVDRLQSRIQRLAKRLGEYPQ
jgi:ubiquinone biosynthesis protein UbiJ